MKLPMKNEATEELKKKYQALQESPSKGVSDLILEELLFLEIMRREING